MRDFPLAAALSLAAAGASLLSGTSAVAGEKTYRDLLDAAIVDAQRGMAKGLVLYEDHSTWENPWSVRTDHYLVRSVLGYARTVKLGDGLETMYGYFRGFFGAEPRALPLRVDVLPDLTAYNQFGEQHGEHHSSSYGAFFATGAPEKPVVSYFDGDAVRLRQYLTHAAVHQYVDGAFAPPQNLPTWLIEGLAGYFETFWDFRNSVAAFDHFRQGNRLVPVDRLLGMGIPDFREEQYVEAGILVYYLMHVREDTRTVLDPETDTIRAAPFRDYVLALLSGGDAASSPVYRLLTSDVAKLDAEFRAARF